VRILDVEAPAFRTATAVGAGIGAVMVLVWWMLLAGRHRRVRQVDKLEAEVRARDEELRTRDEELRTRDLQDRRTTDLEDRRTTEDAVRPTDPDHRPHDSPRD
jgi:C4-dicarboxylate-specific signal transduction histidine kinase